MKEFKIDCSKCSGLCCTALFFSKIDGFPENKQQGKPCSKLQKDYTCKIHKDLKKNNLKGCIGYDCFGAGQYVTSVKYKNESWQTNKVKATEIFEVFIRVYQLFQVRYYLENVRSIAKSRAMKEEIEELINENIQMCEFDPSEILLVDIEAHRNKANKILKAIIEDISRVNKNQDYIRKNYKNKDMSYIDLSMKLLIATNFDGCKFEKTSFLGSDTRDTNFSNSDLSKALFITQGQLNSSRGNKNTSIPKHLERPLTWE